MFFWTIIKYIIFIFNNEKKNKINHHLLCFLSFFNFLNSVFVFLIFLGFKTYFFPLIFSLSDKPYLILNNLSYSSLILSSAVFYLLSSLLASLAAGFFTFRFTLKLNFLSNNLWKKSFTLIVNYPYFIGYSLKNIFSSFNSKSYLSLISLINSIFVIGSFNNSGFAKELILVNSKSMFSILF